MSTACDASIFLFELFKKNLESIKWEALISFLGEKERKNTSEGKKEKKKKIVLSQLSNTVYQRIELT